MTGSRQFIFFAYPHEFVHAIGTADSKLQFYETIKEIKKQLGDKDVTLESYILSSTKFNDVIWNFEQHHVHFIYDDSEYISKIFDKLS